MFSAMKNTPSYFEVCPGGTAHRELFFDTSGAGCGYPNDALPKNGLRHLLASVNASRPTSQSCDEPPRSCSPCRLSIPAAREQRRRVLPELVSEARVVSGLKKRTVTGIKTGLRLRFDYRDGLMATLATFADAERSACSGLQLKLMIHPGGGWITLDVTGPEGTREMLLQTAGAL